MFSTLYHGGADKSTMDKQGKFIVIDGMDGSGKGTQIRMLQERLKGEQVIFTREPGGTPKAEEIREMILKKDGASSNPTCDFFLFFAARGSHVEDLIAPSRALGKHVICDRYDSSTFAFQIRGENQDAHLEQLFTQVRTTLPKRYVPDLYLILDLPAEVAYERRKNDMTQEKSKFDLKPIEYHRRVRLGFQEFATRFGSVQFIDANQSPEEMHKAIFAIISPMLL